MSSPKQMNIYRFAEQQFSQLTQCCCCISLINGIRMISAYSLIFGMAFVAFGSSVDDSTIVFTIIYIISIFTGIWFFLWFLTLLLLLSLHTNLPRSLTIWIGTSLTLWLVVIFIFYIFVLIVSDTSSDKERWLIIALAVTSFLGIALTFYSVWALKSYTLTFQERRSTFSDDEHFSTVTAVASNLSLQSWYRLRTPGHPYQKRLSEILSMADESAIVKGPVPEKLRTIIDESGAVQSQSRAEGENDKTDTETAADEQIVRTLCKSQQTSPTESFHKVEIDDTIRQRDIAQQEILRHIASLGHHHLL